MSFSDHPGHHVCVRLGAYCLKKKQYFKVYFKKKPQALILWKCNSVRSVWKTLGSIPNPAWRVVGGCIITILVTGDNLKGKWGWRQWDGSVKVFVAKTGGLSLTLRTRTGSKKPVSCPPTSTPVHRCTHTVIKQLKLTGSQRLIMQTRPSLLLRKPYPSGSLCSSFYYLSL